MTRKLENDSTPIDNQQNVDDVGDSFSSAERRVRQASVLGVGALAAAATAYTYKYGIDFHQLLDTQVVPTPTVYPGMVDGFVWGNETLRAVAPPVLAGGVTLRATQKIRARSHEKPQAIEELSGMDYSGVDSFSSYEGSNDTAMGRMRARTAKFMAGMGVASLAVVLAGSFSSLEQEIAEGPLRPVDAFIETLSDEDEETMFAFQSPGTTFMDDSYLPADSARNFAHEAQDDDIRVMPFDKALPNIDGRSGLAISLPDRVFEDATGETITETCDDVPIILDETNVRDIGEEIPINDIKARVSDKVSGTAQMNRDVAVLAESDFKNCLRQDPDSPYFGALINGDELDKEDVAELAKESGLDEASVITEDEFKESNLRFWRANGTPLLLQIIAYTGVFGALAIGSEKRGMLQRNVREIGTMNALGVSMKDIRSIELRRALKETTKATLIAAPVMPVVAAVFNTATVGLKAGVGLREVAVGYSIALGAKTVGSIRATRRFSKQMNLEDSVRG